VTRAEPDIAWWRAEVRAACYDLAAHLAFLKLRAELRAFGDLLEEKYRPDICSQSHY
jgi:hypothetical protein